DPLDGSKLHDDLVLSAAMTAVLDEQSWGEAGTPLLIQAADPLREMDGAFCWTISTLTSSSLLGLTFRSITAARMANASRILSGLPRTNRVLNSLRCGRGNRGDTAIRSSGITCKKPSASVCAPCPTMWFSRPSPL